MKPPRYDSECSLGAFVRAALITALFLGAFAALIALLASLAGCTNPAEAEWSRANTEFVRQSGANMALRFQSLQQP